MEIAGVTAYAIKIPSSSTTIFVSSGFTLSGVRLHAHAFANAKNIRDVLKKARLVWGRTSYSHGHSVQNIKAVPP